MLAVFAPVLLLLLPLEGKFVKFSSKRKEDCCCWRVGSGSEFAKGGRTSFGIGCKSPPPDPDGERDGAKEGGVPGEGAGESIPC